MKKYGVKFKDNQLIRLIDKKVIGYRYKSRQLIILNYKRLIDTTNLMVKLLSRLNQLGYRVVFNDKLSLDSLECLDLITKVKELAQDDVKTAAIVGFKADDKIEVVGFTYNQVIRNYKIHAEGILLDYIDTYKLRPRYVRDWIVDLEPCQDCLEGMIHYGAKNVLYATRHKAKWDTPGYLDLIKNININYKELV